MLDYDVKEACMLTYELLYLNSGFLAFWVCKFNWVAFKKNILYLVVPVLFGHSVQRLYQNFLCLRKRRLQVQLGNIQDSARKAQQNHTNEQSGNLDQLGNYAKWKSFKFISCIYSIYILTKNVNAKKSSKLKSKGKYAESLTLSYNS